jgi:hypothetical protein
MNIYVLIKYSNKLKDIRGVNGGLSKALLVHPSTDPSTKLDGSFISYDRNRNEVMI